MQGSSIGVSQYMVATALGLLPTQVINVYLGSTLRSMQDVLTDDNTATTGYIVFSIQVTLLKCDLILKSIKFHLCDQFLGCY